MKFLFNFALVDLNFVIMGLAEASKHVAQQVVNLMQNPLLCEELNDYRKLKKLSILNQVQDW